MKRNPAAVLGFTLLVLAVLLAGCGGEEPAPTPAVAPPTAPPIVAITAAARPTAAASTPRATSVPQASTAAAVAQAALSATGAQSVTGPVTAAVTGPVTASLTATATASITASVTPCVQPAGWFAYEIQPGDTLTALAIRGGVLAADLARANCLSSDTIIAGRSLLLPVDLRLTPTPCALPDGWIAYTVAPNDTLSELAARTGATFEEIQRANCLPDTLIVEGRPLYLPVAPARRAATTTPARVAASAPVAARVVEQEETQTSGALLAPPGAPPAAPPAESGAVARPAEGAEPPENNTLGAPPSDTPPPVLSPFARLNGEFGSSIQSGDPNVDVRCPSDVNVPFQLAGAEFIEIGDYQYFYACNPPNPAGPMTAQVSWIENGSTQTRSLPVYQLPPNDTAPNTPRRAAIWHAVPGLPTDVSYRIVMEDSASKRTASLDFTLTAFTDPRILIVPSVGYAGGGFEVYLVNYPLNSTVTVEIRGTDDAEKPFNCSQAVTEHTLARFPISVLINQTTAEGVTWGYYPFSSQISDPPGCYALSDNQGSAEGIVVLLP